MTKEANRTTQESTKNANHTHSKRQRRDFLSKIPFNISENEMDIMILCTAVSTRISKKTKIYY